MAERGLTRGRRELLEKVPNAEYGQMFMYGSDLRMAKAMVAQGLLAPCGYATRYYELTDAGRAALQDKRS